MIEVMAVAPHPDDVEFGCGGILFKLNKEQYHITVLCNTCFDIVDCTDLSQKRIRLEEQREACEVFNADCIFFDAYKNLDNISDILRKLKPNFIFLPWENDFNPTHMHVTSIIKKSIFEAQNNSKYYSGWMVNQLAYYETFSSINFKPEFNVDVSDVFSQALMILKKHKYGLKKLPSLLYKYKINHQKRGIECSTFYAEGIIFDKTFWMGWKQNSLLGIDLLYSMYR